MRYYIADCHFFHSGMNERMDKRGFSSGIKMNEYMIKRWNERVRKNDEVVILGDLSIGNAEQTNELLARLNGRLYMIRGNHDKWLSDTKANTSRFKWVKDYAEMNDNGRKVILSHYPIMCYNGQFRRNENGEPKTWMLYGHVHRTQDCVGIQRYIDFVKDFSRIQRGFNEPVPAPIQMINCFCMYSDYVPLTLDEWIELNKSGILMKSVQDDWRYDG